MCFIFLSSIGSGVRNQPNTLYYSELSTRRTRDPTAHAPLKAAPFFKGAELEAVVVVVERAASALAPVTVSVTRDQPLYENDGSSSMQCLILYY